MALGIFGRAAGFFQLLGADRLLQRFTGRGERAANLQPAFSSIEERWYEYVREVFATEGAAGGSPWAPLSEAYAAYKALHTPGPILQRTGSLLESLTGGKDSVREVRADSIILGSRLRTPSGHVLAALHQYGAGALPARPIISLSPEFVRETREALSIHLTGTEL